MEAGVLDRRGVLMEFLQFLSCLLEDGRVTVSQSLALSAEDLRQADTLLTRYERLYRLEMPGEAPPFSSEAAAWAAIHFYRASQFTVFRDFGAEVLEKQLRDSLPPRRSPSEHYSVDLIFRYLPDLMKFAKTEAKDDPLLGYLQRWAVEWPLSSVGMRELGELDIDAFADHPGLLQLYVDRIIATNDQSRLHNERVRQAIAATLGMYPQLSPRLRQAIEQYQPQESTHE